MNKPVLIGLGIGVAAAVGFVLYKGTALKETADINVSLQIYIKTKTANRSQMLPSNLTTI